MLCAQSCVHPPSGTHHTNRLELLDGRFGANTIAELFAASAAFWTSVPYEFEGCMHIMKV